MTEAMLIKVRIIQLGKKVFDYEGPHGSTVASALEAAGVVMDRLRTDIRVNGETAGQDQPLRDGDIITVLPPVKGGREKKLSTDGK